tara:strand:+ start:1899 stop:3287 length:1389 start_codon:yes stop_codon:yes gene_type:complete
MTNNIFEDLPKRKHPQAAAGGGADAPEGGGGSGAAPAPAAKSEGGGKKGATGGTEENSEKRVRQAVYDIRYRARREDIDLKAAYSQYMSNTSMSAQEQAQVKAKLFGKEGGVKEQVSVDGADWVVEDLSAAMKKVFVAKEEGPVELVYERMMQAKRDGKDTILYSIRVTDPKSGKTYTRDANREKITQLRAAGLKVEMSDHKPGQAQRDMSKKNDGNLANNYPPYNKVTRGDVIAGATGKDQMGGKRKVSEGTTLTGPRNGKKIDVMKSGEMNNVTVFPKDGSDPQIQKPTIQAGRVPSKSLTLFQEKHGMESTICPKHGTTPCKCKEGGDKEDERDTRADSTIRNVVKNKLRAMGMKTPLIMKDPEELEKEYAKIASADTAKIVNEEDTDRLRDRRNMHGGVDGNTNYKRPGTGVRTLADKQSKPKPHPTNKSAIETVAAELRARYGGSAVIGGSLKKKES